jgi:hypothetical protein
MAFNAPYRQRVIYFTGSARTWRKKAASVNDDVADHRNLAGE